MYTESFKKNLLRFGGLPIENTAKSAQSEFKSPLPYSAYPE